jgi:hypothetical protein
MSDLLPTPDPVEVPAQPHAEEPPSGPVPGRLDPDGSAAPPHDPTSLLPPGRLTPPPDPDAQATETAVAAESHKPEEETRPSRDAARLSGSEGEGAEAKRVAGIGRPDNDKLSVVRSWRTAIFC